MRRLTIVVLLLSVAAGFGFSIGIRKVFRLNPSDQEADLAIDVLRDVLG